MRWKVRTHPLWLPTNEVTETERTAGDFYNPFDGPPGEKTWGWFRGPPFRSPLQGGLKGLGARGGRGLHLRKASRGLEGGFKGA